MFGGDEPARVIEGQAVGIAARFAKDFARARADFVGRDIGKEEGAISTPDRAFGKFIAGRQGRDRCGVVEATEAHHRNSNYNARYHVFDPFVSPTTLADTIMRRGPVDGVRPLLRP